MAHPSIGIDLGTTFSCIAFYDAGQTTILSDRRGKRLIPSILYVCPDTGKYYVGEAAFDKSIACHSNLLKDSKRLLGRKYDDEAVKNIIASDQTNFNLVKTKDGMVAYKILVKDAQLQLTPEEVSSEILKYLKASAEYYFKRAITEAVISIPAYFSNAQRKATQKAATLAGLNVLRLITEPVAGALHYIKNRDISSKLMVFDWGGGTLDVSFINVNRKVCEVMAVYGDTQLGGRNVDDEIFKRFYRPVTRQPERFIRRLLVNSVKLKEHLSVEQEFTTIFDCYDGVNDLEMTMTRKDFNDMNSEIFKNITDIVKYGLNNVGLRATDINHVILVGGSTKIPKIHEILIDIFGAERLKTDLSPDEAVAMGACLRAAALRDNATELERYKVSEVTPLSLGLDGYGDLTTVFIPRNSKLPATQTKSRVSVYNDQDDVTFDIYEGERKNSKYNNKLGSFKIQGLPKKRAGDVDFSVTFHLDENGILTVTASESSTGKKNQLVVTMSEFRLSEKQLKMECEEAKKARHEDELFEKFVTRRNALLKRCRAILYDLEKITDKDEKDMVKMECTKFIVMAEALDFLEMDKLEERFLILRDKVFPVIQEYGHLEIKL